MPKPTNFEERYEALKLEVPENLVVYTPDEAAAILKVHLHNVYSEIKHNRLRARYVGNRLRIRKTDLLEYQSGQNACDVDAQKLTERKVGNKTKRKPRKGA